MSTKINGLKELDKNEYERIIIRDTDEGFRVDIKSPKVKANTLTSGYKISSDLKNTLDEEKINIIINTFLENTKICYISDRTYYPRYKNSFINASGSRELLIAIGKGKLKNERRIPRAILSKYITDRMEFCMENEDIEHCEFWTRYGSSSYTKRDISNGKKLFPTLKFQVNSNLLKQGFEREFIKEFLYDRLYKSGEEAEIISKQAYFRISESYVGLGTYVVCGKFIARLDRDNRDLVNIARNVVDTYNKERENNKKMQLKMEGF